MAEYEMPIEEQVKSIAKELRAVSAETRAMGEAMTAGFVEMRAGFVAMRAGFVAMRAGFDAVDKRFAAVDRRFAAVDERFAAVDQRFDKLQILGQETKAIAKLGLEGIEALRESTDAKFAEAATVSSAQTELLKSALVHARKRVDVIEPKVRGRAKTRRPRS